MADLKNTARSKRKYGDREGKTAANKTRRTARHESRIETLKARTLNLIGSPVKVGGQTGKVEDVLYKGDEGYPNDSRPGAVLRVTLGDTTRLVHRRKIKPVPAVN